MRTFPALDRPGEASVIATATETLALQEPRLGRPVRSSATRKAMVLRGVAGIAATAGIVVTLLGSARAAPVSRWAFSLDGPDATLYMTAAPEFAVDEATYRAGLRSMARSKRDAVTAAFRCLARPRADFRVGASTGEIAGPSAGLMFALGVVDRLAGGEITQGRRVAGTGTISPRGVVGQVGNIAGKLRAAQEVGADVFLVPFSQVEEARETAIGVDVVGVRDLDEALRHLHGHGCARGA